MDEAKIRLSQAEMELVMNAGWILTKNRILDKIKGMLGELVNLQKETLYGPSKVYIPEEVQLSSFKISRGENYLGLPWLILDHPRFFSKNDVLAIRTLFWWGRCFSVTLHLAGKYKSQFEKNIINHYDQFVVHNKKQGAALSENDYYICTNTKQWEHHFDESNYRTVKQLQKEEWQDVITQKTFIKLAKMIPLEHWKKSDYISDTLAKHYFTLAKLLQAAD